MFEKEFETIRDEWSEHGRDTTLCIYTFRESQITEDERDKAALDGLHEFERKHAKSWI